MNEVIISTSRLNCYGSRVLTEGIDLTQYKKNPILLWMHRRCYEGDAMPIGCIENIRIEGDALIGTPRFDDNDEFSRTIKSKWENGFLRMASAGIEVIETSGAPEYLLPGQTRATVTLSRLAEVSIVDIGANDDALKLYSGGKLLTLASGADSSLLPLLQPQTNHNMKKETLELLGLGENATEQEQHDAIKLLKAEASRASQLELSSINAVVEAAVSDGRISADKKAHFVSLGQKAGVEALRQTLDLMTPARRPGDIIHPSQPGGDGHYAKLSDVPEEQRETLRSEQPQEYMRLYKAEYGIDMPTQA